MSEEQRAVIQHRDNPLVNVPVRSTRGQAIRLWWREEIRFSQLCAFSACGFMLAGYAAEFFASNPFFDTLGTVFGLLFLVFSGIGMWAERREDKR